MSAAYRRKAQVRFMRLWKLWGTDVVSDDEHCPPEEIGLAVCALVPAERQRAG